MPDYNVGVDTSSIDTLMSTMQNMQMTMTSSMNNLAQTMASTTMSAISSMNATMSNLGGQISNQQNMQSIPIGGPGGNSFYPSQGFVGNTMAALGLAAPPIGMTPQEYSYMGANRASQSLLRSAASFGGSIMYSVAPMVAMEAYSGQLGQPGSMTGLAWSGAKAAFGGISKAYGAAGGGLSGAASAAMAGLSGVASAAVPIVLAGTGFAFGSDVYGAMKENWEIQDNLERNSFRYFRGNMGRGFNRSTRQEAAHFIQDLGMNTMTAGGEGTASDIAEIMNRPDFNSYMIGTSDLDDFKKKMETLVKNVKSVALTLNESYKQAVDTVMDLRKMGITDQGGIATAATSIRSAGMASGFTGSEMLGFVKNSGSQFMGTAISQSAAIPITTQSISLMAGAQATGLISTDLIANAGGLPAAAQRISATSVNFMRTNDQMKALMASMINEDGSIDQSKIGAYLAGDQSRLEVINEGAAKLMTPRMQAKLEAKMPELMKMIAPAAMPIMLKSVQKDIDMLVATRGLDREDAERKIFVDKIAGGDVVTGEIMMKMFQGGDEALSIMEASGRENARRAAWAREYDEKSFTGTIRRGWKYGVESTWNQFRKPIDWASRKIEDFNIHWAGMERAPDNPLAGMSRKRVNSLADSAELASIDRRRESAQVRRETTEAGASSENLSTSLVSLIESDAISTNYNRKSQGVIDEAWEHNKRVQGARDRVDSVRKEIDSFQYATADASGNKASDVSSLSKQSMVQAKKLTDIDKAVEDIKTSRLDKKDESDKTNFLLSLSRTLDSKEVSASLGNASNALASDVYLTRVTYNPRTSTKRINYEDKEEQTDLTLRSLQRGDAIFAGINKGIIRNLDSTVRGLKSNSFDRELNSTRRALNDVGHKDQMKAHQEGFKKYLEDVKLEGKKLTTAQVNDASTMLPLIAKYVQDNAKLEERGEMSEAIGQALAEGVQTKDFTLKGEALAKDAERVTSELKENLESRHKDFIKIAEGQLKIENLKKENEVIKDPEMRASFERARIESNAVRRGEYADIELDPEGTGGIFGVGDDRKIAAGVNVGLQAVTGRMSKTAGTLTKTTASFGKKGARAGWKTASKTQKYIHALLGGGKRAAGPMASIGNLSKMSVRGIGLVGQTLQYSEDIDYLMREFGYDESSMDEDTRNMLIYGGGIALTAAAHIPVVGSGIAGAVSGTAAGSRIASTLFGDNAVSKIVGGTIGGIAGAYVGGQYGTAGAKTMNAISSATMFLGVADTKTYLANAAENIVGGASNPDANMRFLSKMNLVEGADWTTTAEGGTAPQLPKGHVIIDTKRTMVNGKPVISYKTAKTEDVYNAARKEGDIRQGAASFTSDEKKVTGDVLNAIFGGKSKADMSSEQRIRYSQYGEALNAKNDPESQIKAAKQLTEEYKENNKVRLEKEEYENIAKEEAQAEFDKVKKRKGYGGSEAIEAYNKTYNNIMSELPTGGKVVGKDGTIQSSEAFDVRINKARDNANTRAEKEANVAVKAIRNEKGSEYQIERASKKQIEDASKRLQKTKKKEDAFFEKIYGKDAVKDKKDDIEAVKGFMKRRQEALKITNAAEKAQALADIETDADLISGEVASVYLKAAGTVRGKDGKVTNALDVDYLSKEEDLKTIASGKRQSSVINQANQDLRNLNKMKQAPDEEGLQWAYKNMDTFLKGIKEGGSSTSSAFAAFDVNYAEHKRLSESKDPEDKKRAAKIKEAGGATFGAAVAAEERLEKAFKGKENGTKEYIAQIMKDAGLSPDAQEKFLKDYKSGVTYDIKSVQKELQGSEIFKQQMVAGMGTIDTSAGGDIRHKEGGGASLAPEETKALTEWTTSMAQMAEIIRDVHQQVRPAY